jgi:hypothetical protein
VTTSNRPFQIFQLKCFINSLTSPCVLRDPACLAVYNFL